MATGRAFILLGRSRRSCRAPYVQLGLSVSVAAIRLQQAVVPLLILEDTADGARTSGIEIKCDETYLQGRDAAFPFTALERALDTMDRKLDGVIKPLIAF